MSDVLVPEAEINSDEITEAQTAEAWKAKAGHPITLPSGTVIRIRIPNLAQLAKTGELPNELLKAAIPEIAGPEPAPMTEDEARAAIEKLADFQTWITASAVVSPDITPADVPALPTEDVELIVAIATRQRDLDAVGHQIGGLEKVADFRRFRGLTDGDEDVLG